MKSAVHFFLSAIMFAIQPLCFAADARATADQRLMLETRTFNKFSTVDDALKLMGAFYPKEAVNKVRESAAKSGLAATAPLPKIQWKNGIAKIEGVDVKLVSEQPLAVSVNGKIWRYNRDLSLDQNYAELFETVSGGFSKAGRHAAWSLLLPDANAGAMTAATNFMSFAGITISILTFAAVTWPSWVVIGTAFAVGVAASALIEYLLPDSPKILPACTDNGATIEFTDSHEKFVIEGTPEKIASLTVTRPNQPDHVVGLNAESEAQFKAMVQVCKENPKDVAALRKAMEQKRAASPGSNATS